MLDEISWGLLRKQKKTLLKVIMDTRDSEEKTDLDGILGLLDYIQDEAVETGIATEKEVFDLDEERNLLCS